MVRNGRRRRKNRRDLWHWLFSLPSPFIFLSPFLVSNCSQAPSVTQYCCLLRQRLNANPNVTPEASEMLVKLHLITFYTTIGCHTKCPTVSDASNRANLCSASEHLRFPHSMTSNRVTEFFSSPWRLTTGYWSAYNHG